MSSRDSGDGKETIEVSVVLRAVLIIMSLLTLIFIMRWVRQSKMRIEDSVIWIGFSAMLLIFSLFPGIVYFISDIVGTQAPVNFIFMAVIFILMMLLFRLTMKVSELETKIEELVEKMAVDKAIERENGENDAE